MKWVVAIVILLLVGIVAGQWVLFGARDIGPLESINGIPYVATAEEISITEKLAHADIYLHEPVVGKTLTLNVMFHPGNTNSLGVGVRENDFWLSYVPIQIWDGTGDRTWQRKTVSIPLTNKFQEPDQSVDLMFFGSTDESLPTEDEGANDTVRWSLRSLEATVEPTVPSWFELKDFIRSVLMRERAQ